MNVEQAAPQGEEVAEQAATPENVEPQAPETEAGDGESSQADEASEKSFTQDDVDRIVQKEKAKAEARAERRALKAYAEKLEQIAPQQRQEAQPKSDPTKPKMGDFEQVEDYVEAVADWKLAQRDAVAKQQEATNQRATIFNKTEAIYAEAAKIEGFNRDDFDELTIPQAVAKSIIESDVAPKLMAHFAANPDEVERISKLSDVRQAVEIGKLEVKLSEPQQKRVSSAPTPIKPTGAKGGSIQKSIENMTMEEFKAYEQKRIGSRWNRR